MVEKLIREYLKRQLNMKVYLEEPESKESEYLVVMKTGSSRRNHIPSAMITVRSYAASLSRAIDLNELVKETMYGAIELSNIVKVELNSDYNYTDIETKRYRYQAVFDVTHY